MGTISITNNTNKLLRIMLEPLTDTFDIEPSETASVTSDFLSGGEPFEIEAFEDNFLSIFVSGSVEVKIGSKLMEFPEL